MQLFEDLERTDASPARETESTFAFLTRHPSKFFERVRHLLEEWVSHLPPGLQENWAAAFRSEDERFSQSAFWELYLHELFLRLGCSVEIHPVVPGTDKRPDFLVSCDGCEFYLEATLMGISDADLAEERRRDRLYETLQGLSSPDFFIMVDQGFKQGGGDPPGRRIRDQLERWIGEHRWDALRPLYAREGPAAMPTRTWEANGWRLPIRLLPKPLGLRGDPRVRPIGVYGGVTSMSDPIEQLKRPLREKGGRYGVLPQPYIIAVLDPTTPSLGPNGSGLEYQDIDGALYGRTVERFDQDADGMPVSLGTFRKGDGFWQGPPTPQYTRVSAAIVAPNIRPESVANLEAEIWHNPWASAALCFEPPLAQTRMDAAGLIERKSAARAAADVFGLQKQWPGPEGPFEGAT